VAIIFEAKLPKRVVWPFYLEERDGG
jgi:hypothetical protein